ncbi:MOSC domain-containing protein [Roseivivax sp. GX 12232]|uniref:MOSC domain-containing protein n=1 Tax=Roseivivax sp. GX 12232 TaxID=2900547 RepID=UPI001E51E00E|nr:MOSC domain-containing protein [Roseivivax sp. GX 12232]MCE0505299.1 MOSC domain-containing protein [Roseivivax sp. GX 12232]
MERLKDMIDRHAQPGRVVWIGLRPERRMEIVPREAALLGVSGLEGDHARPGKRALTLFQAEHLAAVASYLGREAIAPEALRRNLHVAGLNLASLRDREIALGEAVVRLTTICAPCSRMEEAFGPGGYAAIRGHGGWCAEVVEPGRIALGDPVRPLGDQSA